MAAAFLVGGFSELLMRRVDGAIPVDRDRRVDGATEPFLAPGRAGPATGSPGGTAGLTRTRSGLRDALRAGRIRGFRVERAGDNAVCSLQCCSVSPHPALCSSARPWGPAGTRRRR
jgi:hypothetical protein